MKSGRYLERLKINFLKVVFDIVEFVFYLSVYFLIDFFLM